jgi:hypothetical protein
MLTGTTVTRLLRVEQYSCTHCQTIEYYSAKVTTIFDRHRHHDHFLPTNKKKNTSQPYTHENPD